MARKLRIAKNRDLASPTRSSIDLRQAPPALVVSASPYALHHGTLSTIRSLGRSGVEVVAVVGSRRAAAAQSRYLARAELLGLAGCEIDARFIARVVEIADSLAERPILYCVDDESAILVAEAAAELASHVRLPAISPDLPRELTNKVRLSEICQELALGTPRTVAVSNAEELQKTAVDFGLPVVVKNAEAFSRLTRPVVCGTTVVSSLDRLSAIALAAPEEFAGLVQEYLPHDRFVDWIVHGYCGTSGSVDLLFTGRKLRSWPANRGATALGVVEENAELAELTRRLCGRLGYRGIFGLDWRYDPDTDRYLLLDFNVRIGAQVAMFETQSGLDVIRAMHLDLSDQPVCADAAREGDCFVVENFWLAGRRAYRNDKRSEPTPRPNRYAWWAADDPKPPMFAVGRQLFEILRTRCPSPFVR